MKSPRGDPCFGRVHARKIRRNPRFARRLWQAVQRGPRDTIPRQREAATHIESQTMSSELKTERHGSTLVLTLSDPATRNTLSEQLVSAGVEAINVAESSDEVRAVVLRGDGAHFCAGGNLNGLAARRQSGASAQVQMLEQLHQ